MVCGCLECGSWFDVLLSNGWCIAAAALLLLFFSQLCS